MIRALGLLQRLERRGVLALPVEPARQPLDRVVLRSRRRTRCRTDRRCPRAGVRDPLAVAFGAAVDCSIMSRIARSRTATEAATAIERRIDRGRRASRRRPAARSAAPAARRCDSGRSRTSGSARPSDAPDHRQAVGGRRPQPDARAAKAAPSTRAARSRTPRRADRARPPPSPARRSRLPPPSRRPAASHRPTARDSSGGSRSRAAAASRSSRATAAGRAPAAPAPAPSTPSIAISPDQLPAASTTASPRQRSAIGFDDDLAVRARDARARGSARSSCAPWRRAAGDERARQLAGRDESVRLDQQSADRRRRRVRLLGADGGGVEQHARSRRACASVVSAARRACAFPPRRWRRRACRCADTESAMPLSAATRAMKSSYRSRLRTVRSSSGCLRAASMYGASTPADACVAPMPTGRSSTISTDAPRRASSWATAQPTMPAPTTMMSEGGVIRRLYLNPLTGPTPRGPGGRIPYPTPIDSLALTRAPSRDPRMILADPQPSPISRPDPGADPAPIRSAPTPAPEGSTSRTDVARLSIVSAREQTLKRHSPVNAIGTEARHMPPGVRAARIQARDRPRGAPATMIGSPIVPGHDSWTTHSPLAASTIPRANRILLDVPQASQPPPIVLNQHRPVVIPPDRAGSTMLSIVVARIVRVNALHRARQSRRCFGVAGRRE